MLQGTVTSATTPDTAAVKRDRVVDAGTAAQSSLPSISNMSSQLLSSTIVAIKCYASRERSLKTASNVLLPLYSEGCAFSE